MNLLEHLPPRYLTRRQMLRQMGTGPGDEALLHPRLGRVLGGGLLGEAALLQHGADPGAAIVDGLQGAGDCSRSRA